MSKYARIVNGLAVDVCTDPKAQFHPLLAADFVQVPDGVLVGWTYDGKTWAAPAAVAQPAPSVAEVGNLQPTPPEFLLLLTLTERAAIRAAGATDPVVADLLSMINDSRLTYVDLANVSVQEAVLYMTGKPSLLTKDRAERVLSGLPPKAAA